MPSKDALFTEFSPSEPVSLINLRVGKFGHVIGSRLGTHDIRESPVKLATFEGGRAFFYSLSWPQFSVEGRGLLNSLTKAKSPEVRRTQSRGGVFDDWWTYDLPGQAELMADHAADLEPHWTRFNTIHRLPLIDSLVNLTSGEMREIMDEKVARFISLDYALANHEELFTDPNPRSLHYAGPLITILQHYLNELPWELRGKIDRTTHLPGDNPGYWLRGEDIALIPLSVRERLIRQDQVPFGKVVMLDQHRELETSMILDSGHYSPGKFTSSTYEIEHNGANQVTVTIDESSKSVYKWSNNGMKKVSEDLKPKDKSRKPWIIAAKLKASGEMVYLDGVVPNGIRATVDNNADPIVGMLMASISQDEQRSQLPPELRLSARANPQDMAEAQIPLELLLFQDLMFSGPVFKRMQQIRA